MTPEAVYDDLSLNAPPQPGRAFRAFPAPPGLHIRAFVDGVTRLPGVAFRAERRFVPIGLQLPKMRGATTSILADDPGSHGEVTYEISSSASAYNEVFVFLASRLIIDAGCDATAGHALSHMSQRLMSWARFFSARTPDGPGRPAELGLIGELRCLERLRELLGFRATLQAWTGRSRTIHDFQNTRGAVEAKLTTTAAPERIRISSERQLDDSQVPTLFLHVVLAQETASGPVHVAALVDSLRQAAAEDSPVTAELFEEKLLDAGYVDLDRPLYAIRLAIREEAILRVSGQFPRIRATDLITGVSQVAYDVAWPAIAPYRVTIEDVRSALRVD